MFFYKPTKKELDITDALRKKRANITIGGKPVVIEALKLGQALELFAALGNAKGFLELMHKDKAEFKRYLLGKMPEILAFCLPSYKIDAQEITLAEFADLLTAIWCVNDLERILGNFTRATASLPQLTQALAKSPKL